MKAYKTNLILIFLLLGISPWAFSASAEMSSKHLRLVKDLMNNNLAYSQDATTTNIIEWEEEIVDSLRQKKDYRNMFLMKQMAVYAYSLQAKISEALKMPESTVNGVISELKLANIIQETTGFSRNQIFVFSEYVSIFLSE